jgi:hypothetical protein
MHRARSTARRRRCSSGGGFLARSGRDVFNTFVLALPTGQVFTHDKDFPTTSMESSLYAGGEDDAFVKEIEKKGVATEPEIVPSRPDNTKSGLFRLPSAISVGAAMCWEQVRYRTARRMRGQVDLVLTASGWPAGGADPKIVETPRRLARLVGAPVVHASIVVQFRARPRPTARDCGHCSFPAKARSWTATARASRFAISPKAKACSWARSNQGV